jgi:hypothetical protein
MTDGDYDHQAPEFSPIKGSVPNMLLSLSAMAQFKTVPWCIQDQAVVPLL